MDLKHTHGASVTAIRACYNEDGSDLLAVAGSENIQVLQCVRTSYLCSSYPGPTHIAQL